MTNPRCQVCDLEESVGVGASSLGPISVAYCRDCLNEGAEPIWLWHATIETCGGPEHVRHDDARTFCEGEFVGWETIVATYQAREV